ncbi:hypothetical protein [Mycolicibacterium helvum]|uniref:Uncharacterized protein n=1 Tax=Mycolicibacterium helvum TaxID=1534349 RepID=A0A7I7T3Q1_9MYCO|nr:hypothetical protein [Mycolicibacterium helvum]BBY62825.1 hypothetical protein MHEL_10680 [Mycolicibacterium helvum]
MLTIYLDQNKWIDLARAESGHPGGIAFVDILQAFRRAAHEKRARFPLSCAHYYETGKQRDWTRRKNLSTSMMRLAGLVRIAPPHAIVPWEIRRALIDVFDLQLHLRDLDLFGSGMAHAFAREDLRMDAPAEWHAALPPELYGVMKERWDAAVEAIVLGDVMPEGGPEISRLRLHGLKNLTGRRFVEGQQNVAAWVGELGRHRLADAMLATTFVDIAEPLMTVAAELGIAAEDVVDKANVIIDAIPSRWVEMKLRHLRQANPQKAWEGNDLNDMIALSVAVPYCDVVVTEKSWASLIRTAKVGDRYDTLVTPRLLDVVDRLTVDS